ncbi:polysaccharide biosynthesis protein, partial [Ornithinimicrobium pekingense]
ELIALSGREDIEIQYTGLRPGEKLTEVLFTEGEQHLPTGHALMTAVDVPSLTPDALAVPNLSDVDTVHHPLVALPAQPRKAGF